MRHNSESEPSVAIVANFEGDEIALDLSEILDIDVSEWQVEIATPGLEVEDLNKLNLSNGEGILLTRK